MATWDPPADVDLGVGKPGKPSQARAIRDLPAALAERAVDSPWLNGIGAMKIWRDGFGPVLGAPPEIAGERNLIGNWEIPVDVFRIEVTVIGGGGVGGDGNSNSGTGSEAVGGGGGGGGAMTHRVLMVEPGQIYGITIGAGGRRDFVNPSIDPLLDNFQIGDGARTTFGTTVAAGGRGGASGTLGGAGGIGGGSTDDQGFPTIFGATGGPSLQSDRYHFGQIRSGSGAKSFFGGGAPGRYDIGEGRSAYGVGSNPGIPGAGGGGGHSDRGFGGPYSKAGGRGANGVVIVRY